MNRKSFRTRFSTESRDGSHSKAAFFERRSLKIVPRGLSEACLKALERLLGRSWAPLGRVWTLFGGSWSALETLLGGSWRLLGALGRSWILLRALWYILDRFLIFCPSILLSPGQHFRPSGDRLKELTATIDAATMEEFAALSQRQPQRLAYRIRLHRTTCVVMLAIVAHASNLV